MGTLAAPSFLRDVDANVCMVFMAGVFLGNAHLAWHTHMMRYCDFSTNPSGVGHPWILLGSADGQCVCAVLCGWYAVTGVTGRKHASEPSGCALCVTFLCWIVEIVYHIMNLREDCRLLDHRWQDVPCVSRFVCNMFSSFTLNPCPWSVPWWLGTCGIIIVHVIQNFAMTIILVRFSFKCMLVHMCFVLLCILTYEVSGSMFECYHMRQPVGVCALCVVCVLCICLIVGFEPDDTSSRPGRPGRQVTPVGRVRGRNATPVGRARSRTR